MSENEPRSRTSRRASWRAPLISFFVTFALAFGASAAIAGTAHSDKRYLPNGHYNQSTIVTGSSDRGHANMYRYSGGQAPAGDLGAKARAYRSTGALVCSSPWYYNSQPVLSVGVSCSFTSLSGNVYYSLGQTARWQGSGSYHIVDTYKSRSQNHA